MTVSWTPKSGRAYNVWRSVDLNEGFTSLGPELLAAEVDDGVEDTPPSDAAAFYRVTVRKAE